MASAAALTAARTASSRQPSHSTSSGKANRGRVKGQPLPSLREAMAAYQYIYVMKGLSKVYPGGRKVLDNIWLSFLPGAKIGVLGLNGSGKSTLLRIMAGLDTDAGGESWVAEGASVGFLPQEPVLDPAKTALENVMEGVAETKSLLDRFEAVSARFAEPLDDDEMTKLIAEQGE